MYAASLLSYSYSPNFLGIFQVTRRWLIAAEKSMVHLQRVLAPTMTAIYHWKKRAPSAGIYKLTFTTHLNMV